MKWIKKTNKIIKHIEDELTIMKENQEIIMKQTSEMPSFYTNIFDRMDQITNKVLKYIQDEAKTLKENQDNIQKQVQKYFQDEFILLKSNQQTIKDKLDYNKNLIKFPQLLEKPNDFESDIFKACKEGKLSSIQWLIEIDNVDIIKKVEVDDINNGYWKDDTPIHIASRNGHLPIVQYLIEKHNVYIDKIGSYCTPLNCACENGHLNIVEYLISKGAQIDKGTWTPLHVSANYGRTDIVKYLISKGANRNVYLDDYRTPYACSKNDEIRNILK